MGARDPLSPLKPSATGREATSYERLEAWAQRVYTDRQLVRALPLAGFDCGHRIREINQ